MAVSIPHAPVWSPTTYTITSYFGHHLLPIGASLFFAAAGAAAAAIGARANGDKPTSYITELGALGGTMALGISNFSHLIALLLCYMQGLLTNCLIRFFNFIYCCLWDQWKNSSRR